MMEPWIIHLVVQVAGFAALGGIVWSRLGAAMALGSKSDDLIRIMGIAAATALAKAEGVTMQVGDLEIRVRKLESAHKDE